MDPYDYVASQLPSETRENIHAFWKVFTQNAESLDRCFSSSMKDGLTEPIEVMAALDAVSPELMYEFGPSDLGHSLAITAEWRDELRPLARAVLSAAPDLPRWRFHEARTPDWPQLFSPANFESRFRQELRLSEVVPSLGQEGRIDLIGRGDADVGILADQALYVASVLLGEAVERDWVGACDGEAVWRRILGRFTRLKAPVFDPAGFVSAFRGEIERAKAAMPSEPYAAQDLDTREMSLLQIGGLPDGHVRGDLASFLVPSEAYARAVLFCPRFASPTFSMHDEWFMFARVQRQPEAPFDDVDDRYALEEKLHAALSADGLGGTVAAGHGRKSIYIDFAVSDVAQGVARVSRVLASEGHGPHATLHFIDKGVEAVSVPVAPPSRVIH